MLRMKWLHKYNIASYISKMDLLGSWLNLNFPGTSPLSASSAAITSLVAKGFPKESCSVSHQESYIQWNFQQVTTLHKQIKVKVATEDRFVAYNFLIPLITIVCLLKTINLGLSDLLVCKANLKLNQPCKRTLVKATQKDMICQAY